MKYPHSKLFVFLLLLSSTFIAKGQSEIAQFFSQTDDFFQQYVEGGKVAYQEVSESPQLLFSLTQQLAQFDLESLDQATQKALLINAYNLHVIRSVVDRWPINSPQEVAGFFNGRKHLTAGLSTTLDDLEKQIIFSRFPDARLHFALVCAARGCPPMPDYAFKPQSLDEQLDAQTRNALQDQNFVRVFSDENRVELSEIFQWYRRDFLKEYDDLLTYVNTYRDEPLPGDTKIEYYPYDWTVNAVELPNQPSTDPNLSNIQRFTPSVLLQKGQVEVKVFNNLYTQTAFRNNDREKVDLGQKETFYTGIFQFNYGVSSNSKWNVGFELNYHAVRLDRDTDSSPLKVFGEDEDGLIFRRSQFSYLGPRVRFAPFENIPKFSITSTLQIPLSQNLELEVDSVRRFLAHNRVNWWTQFFYDKSFGDFQLFTEVDLLYRFPTDQVSFRQDAFFLTPLIVFFSYFPNSKLTFNVNAQYWPTFTGLPGNDAGESFALSGDFVQVGAGGKYQLTPTLNLEFIYTNFITSRNEGAGQTFNVGLVFIR